MGRFLPGVKHETHSDHDPRHTALAEAVFLTVWAGLGRWHGDLVLVGGLVPRYLCGDTTAPRALPPPATLDVDLGISLASEAGQYGSVRWDLGAQGFKPNPLHPARLEKTVGETTIPVDFVVEHPPHTAGAAQVQDITASIMPGVNRALATARRVLVAGVDLHGAEQRLVARVCEVGPFLALKLRAFYFRQQPKDAFDVLYTVRHYDGGIEAAIRAFGEEVKQGNPACADAVATLREHFGGDRSPGPAKASHFVLGSVGGEETEEARFKRASIRQGMVDVAARLLKAAGG